MRSIAEELLRTVAAVLGAGCWVLGAGVTVVGTHAVTRSPTTKPKRPIKSPGPGRTLCGFTRWHLLRGKGRAQADQRGVEARGAVPAQVSRAVDPSCTQRE